MQTDRCEHCDEPFEPDYALCWRCGTHRDGQPTDSGFVPDAAPARASDAIAPRTLDCLRCAVAMRPVGRMRFHEGMRAWPFMLGDVSELFVNREAFDVHACPRCGKTEFFLADIARLPAGAP